MAATGSVVLVTNEGNGRMTTTLPSTHVVVMGVERLVPTFADLEAILKVLPRAGVGVRIDRVRDRDHRAPARGRGRRPAGAARGDRRQRSLSAFSAGKYEQILSCIRCGACLDVCPVYRKIGGHAYDAVYTGPIGAVLSPLLDGLRCHLELPFASTLCGACTEVCSARIPLAELIRELREDAVEQGLAAPSWGAGFEGFAAVATRPRLWGALEALALPLLRLLASGGAIFNGRGPLAGWTRSREFRRPEKRSFRALWRRHRSGLD